MIKSTGYRQEADNMGTWIVGLTLAGVIALAIRSMVKDVRQGKSLSCGGDCKHCGGHCHSKC